MLAELDDSGDGELDLAELTDMCTVYCQQKAAAKDGCIAIASLPKEIQPTLAVFDVDGDGSVAPVELARAAELYQKSKQKSKQLTKIVAGLSFVLILLAFAIVGMTAQVIEMSKETSTSADGVTRVAGSDQAAATGAVQQEDSLSDAFGWTPRRLNGVKSLYFPEATDTACPANTYCDGGTELAYSVTGWARNDEAGLTFFTARGDQVSVVASGVVSVTDSAGATVYTEAAPSEGRRRLTQPDTD